MPVLFLLQLVLRGSNGPLAPERLRGTRGVITAFCGQVNDDCVTWNTEGLNEYENRNQTCKTSAYRHNFFYCSIIGCSGRTVNRIQSNKYIV